MLVDENSTKNVTYCPQSKELSVKMLRSAVRMLRDNVNEATMYYYLITAVQKVNIVILSRRFSFQKNATDDVILCSALNDDDAVYHFLTLRERLKFNPYQYTNIIESWDVLHQCERFLKMLDLDDRDTEFLKSEELSKEVHRITIS